MNSVLSALFVILLILLIGFSISFWFKTSNLYKEVQSNKKNIVSIKDQNLINFIKNNNLRNFSSLYNSILIKLKRSNDKNNFIKNELWKVLAYSMCNNNWYTISISRDLFWKNKCDINQIINLENQNNIFKQKFYKFLNSNDSFRRYINTFPVVNISRFKNEKYINTISDSIHYLSLYELLFVLKNVQNTLDKYTSYYNSYQAPYKYFLSHIFFPSKWIWKDPFSGKINVDIFWKQYLAKAWYIDLNLIKKWSNYFRKSYKWLLYQWKLNYISSINVWHFSNLPKLWLSSLPINVTFGVVDDKSFYWLLSKLTSTSNVLNIMLIDEFTYDIWEWVKSNLLNTWKKYNKVISKNKTIWDKYLSIITDRCLFSSQDNLNCSRLFWSDNYNFSSLEKKLLHYLIIKYPLNKSLVSDNNWLQVRNVNFIKKILTSLTKDNNQINNILSEFRWKTLAQAIYNIFSDKIQNFNNSYYAKYINKWYLDINNIDKLIWARLYWCIFHNWYCADLFKKDNSIIKQAILKFANCDSSDLSTACRIKFIDKFWSNYFIAYTMVAPDPSYSLLNRLKDIYTNLSWLIKLNSFTFRKWQTVWNIDNIAYTSTVSLNIFYKGIDNRYVTDILWYIWKYKCSSITNWAPWSIDRWYNYVKQKISNLYNSNLWSNVVSNLNVLSDLLLKLKTEEKSSNNLNKILLNLQAYRILKERWDCN